MDIAKYVLTAVVVMSLVSDLGDVRWLIYVFGLLTTAVCLGGGLVQAACFEDEAQFVEGRRRGELPHAVQREGYFAPILFGRRGRTFVERHLAVALEVYERGMAARDHRRGTVPGAPGLDLDIEFLGDTLLQVDTYALFVDIPAALRNGFGRPAGTPNGRRAPRAPRRSAGRSSPYRGSQRPWRF